MQATNRTRRKAAKPKSNSRRASQVDRDSSAQRSAGDASRNLRFALALALVAAGAWAYANSFGGAFVYDDFPAIAKNPNVRTIWPLTQAMSAPPDTPVSGRPVASLTFAVNYVLSPVDVREVFEPGPAAVGQSEDTSRRLQRNAWGYHFLNLTIHLLAGLVLFGVVRRTLSSGRLNLRLGTASTAIAFAAALIWLVHPLNTEAVTYLAQRSESLAGLFILLALYCAIRSARPRRSRFWAACAVASSALAIGTKETAVAIPVLVMLWDWLFLTPPQPDAGPGWASLLRRRWPMYAGILSTCLLLVFLVPGARSRSVGLWLEDWTPWTYLLTESGVLLHYIRLAAWPSPLILDPYWPMVTSLGSVAVPMMCLTALVVLTIVAVVKRHPLGFIGASFFVVLAPTSSVLPIVTEVAAEHRMYLPLAALVTAAVAATVVFAQGVTRRLVSDPGRRHRVLRPAGLVLLVLLVAALGRTTAARNRDYASDEQIWRDTIAKQPENPRALIGLGADLLGAQRFGEAEQVLRTAVALDARSAEALSNLGAAELALGKADQGVRHLERAVALRPQYVDAHQNLAEAYVARHQHAKAVPHFRLVLATRPNSTVVLNHFGLVLALSSDDSVRNGKEALELAQRAVDLTSRRDPMSLGTLAAAMAELDRFDEAAAAAREAVALLGDDATIKQDLQGMVSSYMAHQRFRLPAR